MWVSLGSNLVDLTVYEKFWWRKEVTWVQGKLKRKGWLRSEYEPSTPRTWCTIEARRREARAEYVDVYTFYRTEDTLWCGSEDQVLEMWDTLQLRLILTGLF